jgi:hypothetical protein
VVGEDAVGASVLVVAAAAAEVGIPRQEESLHLVAQNLAMQNLVRSGATKAWVATAVMDCSASWDGPEVRPVPASAQYSNSIVEPGDDGS